MSAYKVPSYFAEISLNTVFISTIYATVLFTIFVLFFDRTKPLLTKYRNNFFLYPSILFASISIASTAIIGILFQRYIKFLPELYLLLFLVIIFTEFIEPILRNRTLKDYTKLIINSRIKSNRKSEKILNSNNQYVNLTISIFFLLFLALFSTYGLGKLSAVNTNPYYVFNADGTDYALVRSYHKHQIGIKIEGDELVPGEIYMLDFDKIKLTQKYLGLPTKRDPKSIFFNFN